MLLYGNAEEQQQHNTEGAVLSLPNRSSTALYTSEPVQEESPVSEACASLYANPGLPAQTCLLLMFLAPACIPVMDALSQP